MPEIVKAEITQLTLKRLSKDKPQQLEGFAMEVIAKINVNITDPDFEVQMFTSEIRRYAEQSKLTPAEFFIARTCLSRGQLIDVDGEIMKPYKKIDFEMFNQVEEAYLRFKVESKEYDIGKGKIKAFLNPPDPEPTEEQKRAERAKLRANIENCFNTSGECEFAFLIYDDLKNEGVLEDLRKPERIEPIKNRLMAKFLQKEITRNLFYNGTELRQLSDKFSKNEKYKTPGAVVQEVKNEIIKSYFKSLELKGESLRK